MYYICICNENTFTQNRCQIHPRSIHQRLAPRKRSEGICLYNKGFHHQQPSQYKDTKWVNCGWCGKREYFASYELVNFPLKEWSVCIRVMYIWMPEHVGGGEALDAQPGKCSWIYKRWFMYWRCAIRRSFWHNSVEGLYELLHLMV